MGSEMCIRDSYTAVSVGLWLLQRCKQAWSDLQPTHAPIKKPAHGRYLGQAYLAYTMCRQIHVSWSCSSRRLSACEVVSSTYTRYQAGTQHVEDILDRLRLAKTLRAGDFLDVSYNTQNRERHSARRTNNLHNPIPRPKSTPRSYAPECFTQQWRTECAAESPGDQSGPKKQVG